MRKLNPNDYIGMQYGNLTIIEYVGYEKNNHVFIAKCNCEFGTIKEYRLSDLKNKKKGTKTCGLCCRLKHGKSNTRLYRIWKGMKTRCYNPNYNEFSNYGGKGVVVYKEWLEDFINFYNWAIKSGYSDELSIDRIDNDGNYEPSNCRWITQSENTTKSNLERTYKSSRKIKGINEDNEEFTFTNIRKFAREHELDSSSIVKVCKGKSKNHKNWKFSYID